MGQAFDLMEYLMASASGGTKIRRIHRKQNVHVPAFLVADISTRCNLMCPGCYKRWIRVDPSEKVLTVNEWDSIFQQAEQLGVRFVFLTGGEPFLNREVLERAGTYSRMWFILFTSGTLLDEKNLRFLSDHRNLIPVLCLESCSDINLENNGRASFLYGSLMRVMESLGERDLLYGVSVGLTKENCARVSKQSFLRELYRRKCNLVIYLEYEPDETEKNDLLLSEEERQIFETELTKSQSEFAEMILCSCNRDGRVVLNLWPDGKPLVHITANGWIKPRWNKQVEGIFVKERSLRDILTDPLFAEIGNKWIGSRSV